MNFWGFPAKEGYAPAYLDVLERGFKEFFKDGVKANPLKAEYLLPTNIGGLLRDGKVLIHWGLVPLNFYKNMKRY